MAGGGCVNYYERHLGDYARDTAHLTMVEHGAYTLLLDRYYATESPIPADQAPFVGKFVQRSASICSVGSSTTERQSCARAKASRSARARMDRM